MELVFMITALLVACTSYVNSQDLCSVYSQIDTAESHTACLSKSGSISAADQTTIVNNHNRVRDEVTDATDMIKMTWDDKLADLAQRWAENCNTDHDENHDRYLYGYYSVGQNIAYGSSLQDWDDAMSLWEDEKHDWNYATGGAPGKVTGHYTQMIWASSVKIGCGYASCSGQNLYVCNYGPGGNTYGQKPYTQGTAASACGTKDGNLCDCQGNVCRNTGTLDPTTCTCSCPGRPFYDSTDCKINCDQASDFGVCGNTGWEADKCRVYSNMPVVYCPLFCDICPAISALP